MSLMRSDPSRLRLDPTSYERLRQQVLRRDAWSCQSCGTMSSLEVHHKQFRSYSLDDCAENLINDVCCLPRNCTSLRPDSGRLRLDCLQRLAKQCEHTAAGTNGGPDASAPRKSRSLIGAERGKVGLKRNHGSGHP